MSEGKGVKQYGITHHSNSSRLGSLGGKLYSQEYRNGLLQAPVLRVNIEYFQKKKKKLKYIYLVKRTSQVSGESWKPSGQTLLLKRSLKWHIS